MRLATGGYTADAQQDYDAAMAAAGAVFQAAARQARIGLASDVGDAEIEAAVGEGGAYVANASEWASVANTYTSATNAAESSYTSSINLAHGG